MPRSSKLENRPTHVTKGNVFEDLGLTRAEIAEAKIKSDLWRDLLAHITPLGLTQKELAQRLGVHQPDVSNLLNGKLSRIGVGALIHYAVKLGLGFQGKFTRARVQPRAGASKSVRAEGKQSNAAQKGALAGASV